MKKSLSLFLILMSLIGLSSCNYFYFPSRSENSETQDSTSSENSESKEESQESTSSEESQESISSEESEQPKQVKTTKMVDLNLNNYKLGDVYSDMCDIVLETTYTDGTKDYKDMSYTITSIKNIDSSKTLKTSDPFTDAGQHKVTINYRLDGSTKTSSFIFNIKNGVYEDTFDLVSINFNDITYAPDEKLLELNPNLSFDVVWENLENDTEINETVSYSKMKNEMSLSLTVEGNDENVIDEPLVSGTKYEVTASFNKFPTKIANYTIDIPVSKGYYKLEEPTILLDTFSNCSAHEGTTKLLVVTIDLEPGSSTFSKTDWTQSVLNKVDKYFFSDTTTGAGGYYSLKTYYETVSKDTVEIGGQVFGPYKSQYTMAQVNQDTSYQTLHSVFNSAVEYVKESNPTIDWSEYDVNRDGYFDNVHFITNSDGTGLEWSSSPMWPHQYEIRGNKADVDSPVTNVYETAVLGMFSDAITAIHEQGHMFGLDDYYNYSQGDANEALIDYVGSFDMQSSNVGDWNPFSKFAVGWGKPIVVDGSLDSAKITIHSSALTNEFIVIPANIDTYNNSAFDEYFIIELFTNDGPNAAHWKYISTNSTQNAGVRIYHIDARLWDYYSDEIIDDAEELQTIMSNGRNAVGTACTNTSTYGDYTRVSSRNHHDFKYVSVIQKGGEDTFSKKGTSARRVLNYSDLFVTGDTFRFEDYDHFLSKTGKATTTTNEGEIFPYTFYFNEVTKSGCTVTISKNR